MGKLIDKLKDLLDNAADALNEKTEELEDCHDHYGFDIETGWNFENFSWPDVCSHIDPNYINEAKRIKESADRMFQAYAAKKKDTSVCITLSDDERAEINRNETKKNACTGPIALDVFGNYVYFGDEVMKVDYNDSRCSYISIKKKYKTYAFCTTDGPVQRNILLKKVFDEKMRAGLVTLCERSGFYHIEYNRI